MEMTDSYLECKRCFYTCNKKSNMIKHLEKKKLCVRILESYKYNDKDLYDLSLIRIKNNNNVKRNVEKLCAENNLDDKLPNNVKNESENIIIGNNNNNTNINSTINSNNINININITKSFDEEWDLSQIDINK
jgi:hypothetical protein